MVQSTDHGLLLFCYALDQNLTDATYYKAEMTQKSPSEVLKCHFLHHFRG